MSAKTYADKCVHFRGIQHDTCSAGIVMYALDPDPQPNHFGVAKRIPCLKDNVTTAVCAQCHYPTPDEVAAHEAELKAHMERVRARNLVLSAAHTDAPVSVVYVCERCTPRAIMTDSDGLLAHMQDVHQISAETIRSLKGSMLAHLDARDWFQNDRQFNLDGQPLLIKSERQRRRGSNRAAWR